MELPTLLTVGLEASSSQGWRLAQVYPLLLGEASPSGPCGHSHARAGLPPPSFPPRFISQAWHCRTWRKRPRSSSHSSSANTTIDFSTCSVQGTTGRQERAQFGAALLAASAGLFFIYISNIFPFPGGSSPPGSTHLVPHLPTSIRVFPFLRGTEASTLWSSFS